MYQMCPLTSLAGKGGVDSFKIGGGEQRRRSLLAYVLLTIDANIRFFKPLL